MGNVFDTRHHVQEIDRIVKLGTQQFQAEKAVYCERYQKEAFEKSEKIAEDWTGENPEQFLSSFLATRKLHHTRAAKLELLDRSDRR